MATNRINRLLSSVVRVASSAELSFASRLKSIAKSVTESFSAESTIIYFLDSERRTLSHKITSYGSHDIQPCSIPLGEGVAGCCAVRNALFCSDDETLHPDENRTGAGYHTVSYPIPGGRKLCGVMAIALPQNYSLSVEEAELLHDVAAVVGGLIQSSQLSEWSDKRVHNLITLNELGKMVNKQVPLKHLPSFLLNVCHHYVNSCSTILRIVGDGPFPPQVLKRSRRRLHGDMTSLLELEAQYSAKTLSSGMPSLATDIIGNEALPPSCVCVPLRYESKVVGTLTFFGKMMNDGRFCNFDEEDRELFESMATPIAVALEVAASIRQADLLAAENARKVRELSVLYRIGNAMHSTMKLNELIYLALNALVSTEAPIFERAMLFLVNERAGVIQGMVGVTSRSSAETAKKVEREMDLLSVRWEISDEDLTTQQESDFSRLVKATRLPLDKSQNISSRAILEKKLIHIKDATREKRVDRQFVDRLGVKEFAAVPLMAKNEVVGLVVVDNPVSEKEITPDDLRFVQLLFNQAGIAIENSMLYSRIEDAHRDFREVQQRLLQGEKLAAVGEMAASIAHELKGPLVSIGGFAKRLERKFPHDSTEWKYADTITREAARLEKMLTDTLLFSKKSAISCAPCDINTIIDESLTVVASFLEDRKIRVKVKSHPQIGAFFGDFLQLKQVFINLFTNAAEAMKNGGALSVKISPARLEGKDALAVKVLDTGGGIPLEILSNIFNPFFTTKEYGTGLGLPISHRIVANHGGKILIYNRLGVGAQFKVVLPLHPPRP